MRRIKTSLINFFKRALFVVRVDGESGWPALISGRRYVASGFVAPRVGDFAVFRSPSNHEKFFVKRVGRISAEGFFMRGMVSWASSSDDFGIVPWELIVGKLYGTKDRTSA